MDIDSVALSSFFDSATDLLAIADFQGHWLKVSRSWTDVLGWSQAEVLDSVFPELVHPDDVALTIETNRQVRHEGLSVIRFDNRYRCKDGTYQWLRWTGTSDADAGLIYAIAHPLTENEKQQETGQADHRIVTAIMGMAGSGIIAVDLTGTIRTFNAGAETMFGYSAAQMIGQPLSMLMPAHYRRAHEQGLARYAREYEQRSVRQSPMHLRGLAADGTSFPVAVTLNESGVDSPLVVAIVQDLRHEVLPDLPAQSGPTDPQRVVVGTADEVAEAVTVSRGTAEMPDLRQQLERALAARQFLTHYQPVVSAQGEFLGMEALLRWQSDDGTPRPAVDFIVQAERARLIGEIGRVSIDAAIRDTAQLVHAGHWPQGALCTINLSPSQLAGPTIVTDIENALRDHELDAATIGLEITEFVVMDNDADALARLAELRALGCRVLLDDFGTGYASMSYLHDIPIDGIKLDGGFVHGVCDSPIDAAIISSQISLAALLDLAVIAEGVEEPRQLASLERRGCRRFQGFLFSPAVPIDVIRERLESPEEGQLPFPPVE